MSSSSTAASSGIITTTSTKKILMNYYSCNRYTLWSAFFVLFIMTLFIAILKMIVFEETFYSEENGVCSPFSFFLTNQRTLLKKIQNEIFLSEKRKLEKTKTPPPPLQQESFINMMNNMDNNSFLNNNYNKYTEIHDSHKFLSQIMFQINIVCLAIFRFCSKSVNTFFQQTDQLFLCNEKFLCSTWNFIVHPFLYSLFFPILRFWKTFSSRYV